MLQNHREKGRTCKLRNYWEDTAYVVTEKNLEIPVYTIIPEVSLGKAKWVHKNNIMNCNTILPEESVQDNKTTWLKRKVRKMKEKVIEENDDIEELESDEEDVVVEEEIESENIEDNNVEVVNEVESNEGNNSEEEEEDRLINRRSQRVWSPPEILTYDDLGGRPVTHNR